MTVRTPMPQRVISAMRLLPDAQPGRPGVSAWLVSGTLSCPIGAVRSTMRRLADQGRVEMRTHPGDARRWTYRLTP